MSAISTEQAWARLGDDLRRFIRQRVADEHTADDLLQDTFVRIHRGIDSLAETERLAAWVYQIARNVIHDHYRRARPDTTVLEEVVDEVDDGIGQSECRGGACVEGLIDELPDGPREVLQLAEREGLPHAEIAQRLGLSLTATKSRIQRGRMMLKDVLNQCCTFQFDRRGNLVEIDPKPGRTAGQCCEPLVTEISILQPQLAEHGKELDTQS
jgi:RNA polymerase sigma-70 factor (ECF subfamily)